MDGTDSFALKRMALGMGEAMKEASDASSSSTTFAGGREDMMMREGRWLAIAARTGERLQLQANGGGRVGCSWRSDGSAKRDAMEMAGMRDERRSSGSG
jgi:hypothetical protein